jgi:hypothetical protein
MFMEGYLTTEGQTTSDAHQMIADAGFEVTTTVTPAEPETVLSIA